MEIKTDIIDMYIQIYKKDYPINEETQPRFWEAVKVLAKNPNADVRKLINEEEPYIIRNGKNSYVHVSRWNSRFKKVEDVVREIASEISNYQNPELQGYLLCKFIKESRREPRYKPPQRKRK